MPLARGTRLGTYEIIAPLGSGGMGEVYRAEDLLVAARISREAPRGPFTRPRALWQTARSRDLRAAARA